MLSTQRAGEDGPLTANSNVHTCRKGQDIHDDDGVTAANPCGQTVTTPLNVNVVRCLIKGHAAHLGTSGACRPLPAAGFMRL